MLTLLVKIIPLMTWAMFQGKAVIKIYFEHSFADFFCILKIIRFFVTFVAMS